MELGVMVTITESTEIATVFQHARAAGFKRGQVTSYLNGLTAEEVRQMAVAAREAEFHVDAVGCYINPLRPEDATLQSADITDWKTLVENMVMMNGVERIVCWSGTLGRELGTPNLLNSEEATFNSLYIGLSGLLEQVRGLPVEIILEPYTAHVLHDAASCLRMAQKFPGGEVKIVLDAPNLIPHTDFVHRSERVQALVTKLAPAVGLVHLKDMTLGEDDHRRFVPAGTGTLDYGPYLHAIVKHLPEVPIIVKQVKTVAEMRAAREFLEGIIKEYGL